MGRRRGRSGRVRKGRHSSYGGQATVSQAGGSVQASPRAAYPAASRPRESALGIEPSFHNPEASSNFLPPIYGPRNRRVSARTGGARSSGPSPSPSPSPSKLPYLKQNIAAVKLQSQGGPDRVGVLMKQGVVLPIQRLGDFDAETTKQSERKPRHLRWAAKRQACVVSLAMLMQCYSRRCGDLQLYVRGG